MAIWQSMLRAPRWAVASTLALAAAVPDALARWVPLLVETALDAGIPVFFVAGLSLLQQQTVGLLLAWLLFAYLVFEYTHLLYPDKYASVIDHPEFRFLTTVFAVVSGVFFWGSLIPRSVPGDPDRLVTGAIGLPPMIAALFAILISGTVAFWVYYRYGHPSEVLSESSDLTAMWDAFFHPRRGGVDVRQEWSTLPPRWERRLYVMASFPRAFMPVVMAVLVGLVGVVVNLFYPIPEIALFAGLVTTRFLPDRWREGPRGRHRPFLFDVRFIDSISGASRNAKGMVMLLYTAIGSIFSAVLYVLLLAFSVGAIVGYVTEGVLTRLPSTPTEWVALLGVVVLLVLVFASFLLVGPYSLLHWVRQFERIEPYSRHWKAKWFDESVDSDAPTGVVRPPGLLLPAHLPLLVLGSLSIAFVVFLPETVLAAMVGLLIAILSFGGAVGVMVLGLRWTRAQPEPQPLAHEARDLVLTLSMQVLLVAVLAGIEFDPVAFDPSLLTVGIVVIVILGVLMVMFDVSTWAKALDGPARFLGDVPIVVLAGCFILLVELSTQYGVLPSPRVFQGLIIGLTVLDVGFTAFSLYLDRLSAA